MWYREAQQGRLNLDKQTGIENFREELKLLIGKSLVRNKLNPLEFVVDFDKLNKLLKNSPFSKYISIIKDVGPENKLNKKLYGEDPAKGIFDSSTKEMFIPRKYNSRNLATVLHEAVHSVDPIGLGKSLALLEEDAKDWSRPYYARSSERIANFENLDQFYSSSNLKKVLDIFYIKDKKKYANAEIATKAFMDDMKNYFQNPKQSILFQTSRFHTYLVAVNNYEDPAVDFISNSFGVRFTDEQNKKIIGNIPEDSALAQQKLTNYLRNNPSVAESRDTKYYNQLQKFFTNVYLRTAKEVMPSYNPAVKPFNVNSSALSQTSKNWIINFLKINRKYNTKLNAVKEFDNFIYQRRDLYNKFISTLRTLNVALDESFNFQDPRWQLLEPVVELLLNEFIKYLENPQAYKSNLETDEQRTIKQLNDEIFKIRIDDTILDKRSYFLEHWSDTLKTLGTLEQHELLEKLPITSIEQGRNIMKNIGQKL